MGKVTGATIFYDDGSCSHTENAQHLAPFDDFYRIEFEYDYGLHLLPSQFSSNKGMWRYHSLLPLEYEEILYPLPIGNTPLVALRGLRELLDLPSLWIKDETRSPTGSNKDRATALILENALHNDIHTISCASTGNVAVSLAIGAAACGKKAVIFVPADVSDTKLLLMCMSGATVFKVIEGYEAAVQISRRAARIFGWYDRNTGYNPLTVEAKKTVALEIWEQLGYQLPDVVVIPVGDGVTFSGIAKGFRELKLCGATSTLPRLIGIQAAGCSPLKVAWERNEEIHPTRPATIADGIAVGFPTYGTVTLHNVREHAGAFLTVSDSAIIEAVNTLTSHGGILAEPAGAAAFAGVQTALDVGLIQKNQVVVVLITGTILKTPHYIHPLSSNVVHQISASIDDEQLYEIHLSEIE